MNCIIQYYVPFNGVGKDILKEHFPDVVPEWVNCSVDSLRKYAEHHGCNYSFYREKFVNATSNFFEAMRVFLDPSLDQYENILYVDCDVLVKDRYQNVFDIPFTDIAGVPEQKHPAYKVPVNWGGGGPLAKRYSHFGASITNAKTVPGIRMINSGVVLWSKQARLKARKLFISHEEWFNFQNALIDPTVKGWGHSSHCLDQPYLNCMWTKHNFNIEELSVAWNRFPTHDEKFPCVFAHYVQNERFRMPEIYKSIS